MINKETQLVEPKIFALLVEFGDTNFISVQLAFSLEEAFVLAKLEFERIQEQMFKQRGVMPKTDVGKISLFASKTVYELNNLPEIKPTDEEEKHFRKTVDTIKKQEKEEKTKKDNKEIKKKEREEKNKLMSRIIGSKDEGVLEKNKHLFTKSEIKFIEDRLK